MTIASKHIVKVVCTDHPKSRSTVIQRFNLRRRPVNCAEALRWQTPGDDKDALLRNLAIRGLTPSCSEDIINDALRSHEWCADCSGSTWRVVLTGEELLINDVAIKSKYLAPGQKLRSGGGTAANTRHRYPMRCWCGLTVELRHENIDAILSEYADRDATEGVSRVLLRDLAAKVS